MLEMRDDFNHNNKAISYVEQFKNSSLDIKSLKSVVNYDIAKDMDMNVHRIRRTGKQFGCCWSKCVHGTNGPFHEGWEVPVQKGCKKKRQRRAKGRGGGSNRGVRGVDFDLGIGYNPESNNPPQSAALSRFATVNSLKTGTMTQFKSNFVAASSNSQNQGTNNKVEFVITIEIFSR
ncbi:hypothetical protein FXO38_09019, partial [Capsicum annuum]